MIRDAAKDAGLQDIITNGTRLYLCSAEPASNAQVITLALGNKASVTVGAPQDSSPSGREIVCPAQTGLAATANGQATHWALVNGATNTILAATGELEVPFAVVSGEAFNTDAFIVWAIRDPTSL